MGHGGGWVMVCGDRGWVAKMVCGLLWWLCCGGGWFCHFGLIFKFWN